MNIFEFAMEKEKLSEERYRDLAQQCNNNGVKTILNMLADEEYKHYIMVHAMAKNQKPAEAETNVLSDAQQVFGKMREERDTLGCDIGQVKLYIKAQEFEEESEQYYREKAKEVTDNYQKRILTKMAEEERKHYNMLEHIIQFMQRPERWLEDREWSHHEPY